MSDFLNSLKADLSDRRLLPLVAVAAVALLAALAYALLGGGSSSSPTAHVPIPQVPGAGISATLTQTGGAAVAETTNGTAVQRRGSARDPFAELPGSAKSTTVVAVSKAGSSASTASSASSTTSGSSTTSSSGSSSQGGGGSTAPSSSKPKTPSKPKPIYNVAVEFGAIPAGAAAGSAQLQQYTGLNKATPLPSAKQKIVEFVGVTVSGSSKSASFALTGEVILHGPGACLPSATECKLIDLKEGTSEQLEYVSTSGQPVVYEVRVVTISSATASSASVKNVLRAQSKLSSDPLGARLLALAGLHFSRPGVLVFAARPHRAGAAKRGHKH